MAITYEVKMSTPEFKRGVAYDATFFVDEDYQDGTIGTTGIAWGKLIGLRGDGETLYPPYAGNTVSTARYADASEYVKAQGIMIWTSAREIDSTTSSEITSTDNNYYPQYICL